MPYLDQRVPAGSTRMAAGLSVTKRLPALTAAGLVAVGVWTGHAVAQTQIKDPGKQKLSITTRQNPAYDPQGIRLASFVISPSLSTGISYNDNVYARDTNRVSDTIVTVRPELRIKSDFARHELAAQVFLERGDYRKTSGENYTDYGASVSGRLDVAAQTAIPFSASYARDHERRGSPDDRNASEPTIYHLWQASTGIIRSGQKIATKFLATVRRYVYDNARNALGRIDNSDRDRNDYTLYASIGANPDVVFAPFVYGNLRQIDYDSEVDNNGQNRDAMEYEAGAGTIINFSDVTRASVTVGHVERRADDPALRDIQGLSYGINLKWEPSTLAAFTVSGERSIAETTIGGSAGSLTSSLRLVMDYEMFPNLVLQPSAGLVERDYNGPLGGRTLTTEAGLQFTYKMNQNLWFTGLYRYTKQDEKEESADLIAYEANTYNLSLKLQF